MKNISLTTIFIFWIIAVVVTTAGTVFVSTQKSNIALGAGSNNTQIFSFSDSTEVNVSASVSTLLLATSSSRQYARFSNNSNSVLFLALTAGGPAQMNKGIRIGVGESYELRDVNLYLGAVYAIASSTAASTTVAAKQ